MFTEISLNLDSPELQAQNIDFNEIIEKVNTVSFVERILPHGKLKEIAKKIIPEKIEEQNCHGITSELVKYGLNLKIVYG